MFRGSRLSRFSSKNSSSFIRTHSKSTNNVLYLNPHEWNGLPADRIFELHNLRKEAMGEKYNPNDDERNAILSTFTSLTKVKPSLDYAYEIDNFKERHMNNTPVNLRGLPPLLSNVNVINKGSTPHDIRRVEQLTRVSAYEMPLLAKFRQEYKQPSPSENPIKLTYHSDFSNESNSMNRKVVLSCDIKDLKLSKEQEKKFKLLSGNKFNYHSNTFKLKSNQLPEASQNARLLVDTFNKLLKEAKDMKDDFADIPLDTRHMKAKKSHVPFPESWKRPQDAPVARHQVVRKIVENIKVRKDSEFISNHTP